MSIHRLLRGAALVASAAAIAAPLLNADRKPDGSGTGFSDSWTAEPMPPPPGSTGWGKGSIVLPVDDRSGSMVGVLQPSDASARYFIQAELTGCMPSATFGGEPQYVFGGLYGHVQRVTGVETTPDRDAPWLRIEGTWSLDKDLQGSFAGELQGCNEAGTWYVCGVVGGRFEVSEAMPGPGAPGCFKSFDDHRPFDKSKLLPRPGDDLRSADTIVCPKGGDVAAIDPPKASAPGCFKPFDDQRPFDKTKLLPRPSDDLRSADTIVCPKGGDVAAIDPPKASAPGCFKPFDDQRPYDKSKLLPRPSDDLRSADTIVCPEGDGVRAVDPPKAPAQDLSCMAGWRDVRSTVPPFRAHQASWPVLTGTFDLRYQLFE